MAKEIAHDQAIILTPACIICTVVTGVLDPLKPPLDPPLGNAKDLRKVRNTYKEDKSDRRGQCIKKIRGDEENENTR